MISVVLFFLLGICTLHIFSALPSFAVPSASIVCLMVTCKLLGNKFRTYKLHWALAYVAGFLWVMIHAQKVIDTRLPENLQNIPFMLIGTISSIPEKREHGVRFEVEVKETVPANLWPHPGRIRIHWHNVAEFRQAVHVGDVWQFCVKLKRPHAYANPGSFDIERHFFLNRLNAEGVVITKLSAKKANLLLKVDRDRTHLNQKVASSILSRPIDRLRCATKEKIKLILGNGKDIKGNKKQESFSGLLQALIVGIRDEIDLSQWEVFQNTGTAHLMAISGLHVGLVASFAFVTGSFLWSWLLTFFYRQRIGITLHAKWLTIGSIPAPWVGAILAIISSIFYGMLAGSSVPTQRAVVMVTLFMISIVSRRLFSAWQGFFIALSIALILDPLSTLTPGFWLSFGAVSIILYGMQGRSNPQGIWWRWGRVQWIVFVGLMPITLVAFQKISLISPIANLIAIPSVGFLVVPLALVGTGLSWISETFASLFLKVAHGLFSLLWPFLQYLNDLPKPIWKNANYTIFSFFSAMVGIVILSAPRGFKGRYTGLIWIFPLIFAKPLSIEADAFKVTVLDVGQGLSTVVETKNHVLIYDTGPKTGSNFDTGERVVLPFLATRPHQKIDVLMISHGDNDHAGGAASLLAKIPVKQIISSEPELFPERKVSLCWVGQRWEWDGVQFEVLHPETVHTRKRNDHSCVLRVSVGSHSVLLTGDIETKSEQKMIERTPSKLVSDVMLVPHHGSRTSSSLDFIQTIHPKYAIIPVGYYNRYGHPKPDIVARYKGQGVTVLSTVEGGAISFVLNKEGFVQMPTQYRLNEKRYWMLELEDSSKPCDAQRF